MAKAKKTPNKSEFVRGNAGIPAKEVVLRAKKKGIKLTERYVYVIRSSDKAKAKRRGFGTGRNLTLMTRGRGRRLDGKVGLEEQLRQMIAEVGLTHARRIFGEVEGAFS